MFEKRFVGICGSLRKASRNMGMLRCAAENMPSGCMLSVADINDVPFFREGMEKPDCVSLLARQVREADGLVLAVAEYNYSVAPALKNALDWLSREQGDLLAGKTCALMGAGGGMGTSRAQYHLRQCCVYFDMEVLNRPEVFANAFSDAFETNGDISKTAEGEKVRNSIKKLMKALAEKV